LRSPESIRARRYLLGEASEDERAAIEQEYFADEGALETMEAVEEQLIEDYLLNQLGLDERGRFERDYLSAPHRRRRVETVGGLIAAGLTKPRRSLAWSVPLFALAAAALLAVAAGVWWMAGTQRPLGPTADGQQTAAPPPSTPPRVEPPPTASPAAASAPRVFAFTLSPVSVRAGGDSPSVTMPAGTDVLRLQLEGDAGAPRLERARAIVRPVTGDEVWRGTADDARPGPPGSVAQIDVPAVKLPPDDYIVTLFSAAASGVEQERYRYFLRVR
jgi:hypothetical protein